MHRQEDNYFQLTHAPFRPQHQQPRKESLINRRQQNSAIPFQPLELPPLSQLLPSTTNEATAAAATAAVPPPPSQIDLIQPYNTNDISQFINDPDAAAVAAMAAANVNINRNHMYAYHPMTIIPPTQPQETAAIHEKERPRQPSNSSQLSNSTEKRYSFVTIPGVNQKKRPRRRYDEIERLYHCNWPNCTKSYGTLNHLNAHVSMQKHVNIISIFFFFFLS